jgi:acetoacetyl-CoA synthetase
MTSKKLWEPSPENAASSNMAAFLKHVDVKRGLGLKDYDDLYSWSVTEIAQLWEDLWEFFGVISSQPFTSVIDDPDKMPGAQWFEGARLNFAENLLRFRDDRTALVFKGEGRSSTKMTYAQLYGEVARVAKSLRDMGIVAGDRIAGFMPNMPHSIIGMLAASSIGAIWSSSSPDFGKRGVLDRFGQIKPRVLFCANGYSFKGKKLDSLASVADFLEQLDSVEKVVVVSYTEDEPDISGVRNAVHYADFRSAENNLEIHFEQLPFDHPLYIMYSSGTTGLPKCLVQSAGGILIHHLKELVLHTNLRREDNIFYFTTCGWMMWTWLVSSLAVGATVVLYDGNPFYPDASALWNMADEEDLTVFGTSAGYLAALESDGYKPREQNKLQNLRAVLSTGSPLSVEGFEFVYRDIKNDLQLASICGGTDLNGCFALGNPMLPVHAGELQCRGLGMKVHSFSEDAEPVLNEQGELVCAAPFPSMPIYFWDDADGAKYHNAYFDVYPGIWRHGDFIEINDHGGVTIYGRSDTTLNAGGVRIGTAEIYRLVEQLDEVEDSLVVGQNWNNDVRVILFLKMAAGAALTDDLHKTIVTKLRKEGSPRHVPAKIITVSDIPYTISGKKVELAIKKLVEGKPVLNKDALRNPECLKEYEGIEALSS